MLNARFAIGVIAIINIIACQLGLLIKLDLSCHGDAPQQMRWFPQQLHWFELTRQQNMIIPELK